MDNQDGKFYDLERLLRFINVAMWNRPSDDPRILDHQRRGRAKNGIAEQIITEDTLAAAFALHDALLFGVDLHKLISKPGIDEKRNSQSHPVANIAIAKLNGELTHAQAVEEIMNSEGVQTEKAAIEILSKATKGKQPMLDFEKACYELFDWGEYKVMPELGNDEKAAAVLSDTSLQPFERIKRIREIFDCDRRQAIAYISKNKP